MKPNLYLPVRLIQMSLALGAALFVSRGAISQTQAASGSPTGLKTAPATAQHPLDPLTAREFAVIKKVLIGHGRFDDRTICPWVQLQEPPKAEVLAFKAGDKFRRDALVALISSEKKMAYEAVVDLRAQTIVSFRELGNHQPFVTNPDYEAAFEVIDQSPEVRAALEKRGFQFDGKKISEVLNLDTYAAGADPRLVQDGKTLRGIRVLFADKQGGLNNYGPYLEGIMALVDVQGKRLIALADTPGARTRQKVPFDIFDQTVLGPKAPQVPLTITPNAMVGDLKIDGNRVRWGHWDFRFGFNLREGLVLYQISHDDSGRRRPICYRAAVSEMLVPYSDPSPTWVWREFFDVGEYGLGYVSNEVNAGKELPSNALTLDAVLPDESLTFSDNRKNRVFFFERDSGALFAHTQSGASRTHRIHARGKELVVGFISTIGNYDYLFQWVFRQDASFGFEAELEGLDLSRTVDDGSCQVCPAQSASGPGTYVAEGAQRFGTIVSPQIVAVYHQHWINLRLDFDIDGPINGVKECNTKPLPFDPVQNPRGRAFTVEHTIFGSELEAQRDLNLPSNRSWTVFNPASKSPLGHAAGYEVQAAGNTASAIPASRWGENTSFSQKHFWVTKFQEDQIYAAGRYPSQAPADNADHLLQYAKDNESIYKEDIVVWYSLGFTHITKPEDFPMMPVAKVAVNFAPRGFFTKSPATRYATLESTPAK